VKRVLLSFLIFSMAATTLAEGVHRVHLTFPSGGEFKGLLLSEVPGTSVTVQDATGKRYGYDLGPGVKMWKEWLNVPKERSPWIAMGLSMILPGGGQYYNDEGNLGLAIDGICVGALLFGALTASNPANDSQAAYEVSIAIALGAYVFGIVQAPFAALTGNETRNDMIFGPNAQGLGAKLSF
jgi:hypothetical protein